MVLQSEIETIHLDVLDKAAFNQLASMLSTCNLVVETFYASNIQEWVTSEAAVMRENIAKLNPQFVIDSCRHAEIKGRQMQQLTERVLPELPSKENLSRP